MLYEVITEKMVDKKVNLTFDTKFTRHLFDKVDIKFLAKSKSFFILSGVLILISIGSLAVRGLKRGIDFTA